MTGDCGYRAITSPGGQRILSPTHTTADFLLYIQHIIYMYLMYNIFYIISMYMYYRREYITGIYIIVPRQSPENRFRGPRPSEMSSWSKESDGYASRPDPRDRYRPKAIISSMCGVKGLGRRPLVTECQGAEKEERNIMWENSFRVLFRCKHIQRILKNRIILLYTPSNM